eukprot:gene1256-2609_t
MRSRWQRLEAERSQPTDIVPPAVEWEEVLVLSRLLLCAEGRTACPA